MSVSSIGRVRALHPATIATLLCGVALSGLLFSILQAPEHASNDFDVDRRVQARVAAVARSFDEVQGYLFSRPLPVAELERMLARAQAGAVPGQES